MKTFACFLLFWIAPALADDSHYVDSQTEWMRDLVKGGDKTDANEYPFMVHATSGNCGGSLISKCFVLSAAHCASEFGVGDNVIVGAHVNAKVGGTGEKFKIDSIATYDAADGGGGPAGAYDDSVSPPKHDIMLIKLETCVDTDKYGPVTLDSGDAPAAGTSLTAMGFGYADLGPGETYIAGSATIYNGQTIYVPKFLQDVNVKVVSKADCQTEWDKKTGTHTITADMLCAGATNEDKGVCAGDSGSPLVSGTTQYGVVSYGHKCHVKPYPDVYTRVSSYNGWITAKKADMGGDDCDPKSSMPSMSMEPSYTPITVPPAPPSSLPSSFPSDIPSQSPTVSPTAFPYTPVPSDHPSPAPSASPTTPLPSSTPSSQPTSLPTAFPTTPFPTDRPSFTPAASPTTPMPSITPSATSTASPTNTPTGTPSTSPITSAPTAAPMAAPACPLFLSTNPATINVCAIKVKKQCGCGSFRSNSACWIQQVGLKCDPPHGADEWVDYMIKVNNKLKKKCV